MNTSKNNKNLFYKYILDNINNNYPYVRRFCYVLLLNYFIEEQYLDTIFNLCNIENNDYYVNMSIAWLISICYIKYKEKTLKGIKNIKITLYSWSVFLWRCQQWIYDGVYGRKHI